MQRAEVRNRYNLQGSCLMDLALTVCCSCCSMVQTDKEAAERAPLAASQGDKAQYASQQGMTYPPQTNQ